MGGRLFIAGGNIASAEIYEAFMSLAGGRQATIAVIPTAAEDACRQAEECIRIFHEIGMPLDNLKRIQICHDERQGWVKNGDDTELAESLDKINAVWFTGGDQLRMTRAFIRKDGSNTYVLDKLYELLDRGGVIGGTSAGAAVMSNLMIARGTSEGAFIYPVLVENQAGISLEMEQNPEQLLLTRGFGFFPYGIIDQHFDARDRMGRLMKSISISGFSRGFGIYEDTAMLVDLAESKLTIMGTGKVVIMEQLIESESEMDLMQLTALMDVKTLTAGESFCLSQSKTDFRIQDNFGIEAHFELRDAVKIKDSFTPSLG